MLAGLVVALALLPEAISFSILPGVDPQVGLLVVRPASRAFGQGVANTAWGLFGGMGGCGMIGQTMINVKSGARTRLSTFLAGAFLLALVVVLADVVAVTPMAALVAVMIFVSIATLDWHSLRTLHVMPRSETTVMLTTVAGTLLTHDLALGVGAGVLTACVLFARRVAHVVDVTSVLDPDGTTRVDEVRGVQVWDASTVAAPDAITHEDALRGTSVDVVGLDGHSADRFERHTSRLAAAH